VTIGATRLLHLAENPNDSFLLEAELSDEGVCCDVAAVRPGEELSAAVVRHRAELVIVDVPVSSPASQAGLDAVRRARPDLPVAFRWGSTSQWAVESPSEQLARRVQTALALPALPGHDEAERRALLDRLVRHQQAYLELLRSDPWDFDDALLRILERAADLLEADRVGVWEFSPDHQSLTCSALFLRASRSHTRLPPLQQCPRYLAALEQSLTIAADDARADPRTSELADTYLGPNGITSLLDAPVRRDARLVGVVCHERTGSPKPWALLDQCTAGWVAGLVARAMDFRERRELTERLDSIGRLAGGLAHAFNNSLTAIMGHAELGLDTPDVAEMRQAFVSIREAAAGGAAMVAELLAAGRSQPLPLTRLDLGALVARLEPRLEAIAVGAKHFSVNVGAEPTWARGDLAPSSASSSISCATRAMPWPARAAASVSPSDPAFTDTRGR
jgi:signal transduction histidine kinase